jgi:hypothetical protein
LAFKGAVSHRSLQFRFRMDHVIIDRETRRDADARWTAAMLRRDQNLS